MAINISAGHPGIILPDDVGALVVQPVDRLSVAAQISTLIATASPTFRVPLVTEDVAAGWFAEGAEITEQDPGTDELVITPRKIAALTVISNELANDSSPAAQEVVGRSIARDIARKLDQAYFGSEVGEAPPGIEDVVGVGTVAAGAAWSDLDPFSEAIYASDAEGREISAFITSYSDALVLAQLRDQTDSNRPLLGDPIEGTRRQVLGVPLFVAPTIPTGTVWGIPRDVAMVVRRTDVNLVVDRSRYFERDSVGIRATMRVAFGFPHAAALQRISLTA